LGARGANSSKRIRSCASSCPAPRRFDWALRSHRSALGRFLAKRGRDVLIHDEAASVLAELLLRPEAA